MAICNRLANFEVTWEELLDEDANKVNSTTDSVPEKRWKLEKQRKIAAAEAAKDRAQAMFAATDSDSKSEDLHLQLARQKQQIEKLQK